VDFLPRCTAPLRSWRIGLVLVLATLGQGILARAQSVGTTSVRAAAATQRSNKLSYNRLSSGRQYVVATSSRTAGTSGYSGSMTQGDSLRPYSDQMFQAQAARPDSEIPSSSTQQPPAESEPITVRTTPPRNYYPGMRTGQYLNANTAQISRGGMMGVPHTCHPCRGSVMAGGMHGR
jgi:hypothetical protein